MKYYLQYLLMIYFFYKEEKFKKKKKRKNIFSLIISFSFIIQFIYGHNLFFIIR